MAGSLSIDVFNSGYKPIPGGPGWDDSTPATWPASTSTLISGDRGALLADAPDDNATRVLDQSRRYIEDFGQAVAKSGTPIELIEAMLAKYPAYGNRYTLFAAASSQFPS